MGGNAAEAHPVGFRWAMEAVPQRREADCDRSALYAYRAQADFYAPSYLVLTLPSLSGVMLHSLTNEKYKP